MMANTRNNGIGGWDIGGADDLQDVTLPSNLGKSRDIDPGHKNDTQAQHSGALRLAYSVHGSKCRQCGDAESESALCRVGQELYRQMREAGIVG